MDASREEFRLTCEVRAVRARRARDPGATPPGQEADIEQRNLRASLDVGSSRFGRDLGGFGTKEGLTGRKGLGIWYHLVIPGLRRDWEFGGLQQGAVIPGTGFSLEFLWYHSSTPTRMGDCLST